MKIIPKPVKFRNEYGNDIEVRVSYAQLSDDIFVPDFVTLNVIGPHSEVDHTYTRMEAQQVYRQLKLLFETLGLDT